MKQQNNEWLHWVLLIIPCVYLAVVYQKLPATIPIHFDVQGHPNGFAGRSAMLWIVPLETLGLYLLLRKLPDIDPKKKENGTGAINGRMRLLFTLFMSALAVFELVAAQKGNAKNGSSYMMAGVGGLIAVLGNYMSTIKPNYFIGFRTPWTLENEYVWRKTNRVFGRAFAGIGVLLTISAVVGLPGQVSEGIILLIVAIALASYPYSWYVYSQLSRQIK